MNFARFKGVDNVDKVINTVNNFVDNRSFLFNFLNI